MTLDEGFFQLVVLVSLLVLEDIMLVMLVLPLVVEGTLLPLTAIRLLRLPTLLSVTMASCTDSVAAAKNQAEV